MGWDGRTLPFCYQRTSKGPAAHFFTTQGLIQKSQKPVHVYALVSVDLNICLSLILALLRDTWPSKYLEGYTGVYCSIDRNNGEKEG